MNADRPDISIVMPARNDAYLGNSSFRIEAALNFLGREAVALGVLERFEVLVVDWGSESPLAEALDLNEEARRLTSFLVVPPDLAERASGGSPFPTPRVLNAGIRRARGRYIAETVADILFPRETLDRMLAIAESGQEKLFVFSRKEIPQPVVEREPTVAELREFILENDAGLTVTEEPLLLVPADCQMMPRELWRECRGFDERHLLWGWSDADLNIRIDRRYGTVNYFKDRKLYVYHLEHPVPDPRTRRQNPWFFGPFAANDPEWGLGMNPLRDYGSDLVRESAAPIINTTGERGIRSRTIMRMVIRLAGEFSWRGCRVLVALVRAMLRDLWCGQQANTKVAVQDGAMQVK